MLLYSKTINLFIKKCQKEALLILKEEVGLEVSKKRFSYGDYTYPLEFVVFEDDKKWGYFEPEFFKIALNKKLILFADLELTKNIIRHELAHYLCLLKHGEAASAHGKEYREICKMNFWGEEVYLSTLNLEKLNSKTNRDDLKIQDKIKKLMALTSSTNIHEAQLATSKVNELLIKHNLNSISNKENVFFETEDVYVHRVLMGKRKNAKFECISVILKEFFVHPVFNYGKGLFYLEVVGSKINVEAADYVAKFLNNELENLYKKAKEDNLKLRGRVSKDNFFHGVSKGFTTKLQKGKAHLASSDLELISSQLELSVNLAYPRLRLSSRSASLFDKDAQNLGKKAGLNLSIRPGVTQDESKKSKLLSFMGKF